MNKSQLAGNSAALIAQSGTQHNPAKQYLAFQATARNVTIVFTGKQARLFSGSRFPGTFKLLSSYQAGR